MRLKKNFLLATSLYFSFFPTAPDTKGSARAPCTVHHVDDIVVATPIGILVIFAPFPVVGGAAVVGLWVTTILGNESLARDLRFVR